jgi:hypothetical protein
MERRPRRDGAASSPGITAIALFTAENEIDARKDHRNLVIVEVTHAFGKQGPLHGNDL